MAKEIERKPEQRNKERVPMTAQLVRGEDDDLIAWLESLPEGGKQRAIRSILRVGLGLSEYDTKPMPAVEVAAIDQAAQRRIGELETQMGQMATWVEQWRAYFEQKFALLESYGDVTQVIEPLDTSPGASQEQLEARAANLARKKW